MKAEGIQAATHGFMKSSNSSVSHLSVTYQSPVTEVYKVQSVTTHTL